ncbi:hypothetical protein MTO96_008230 [Rhipicephalus appendiculatus]
MCEQKSALLSSNNSTVGSLSMKSRACVRLPNALEARLSISWLPLCLELPSLHCRCSHLDGHEHHHFFFPFNLSSFFSLFFVSLLAGHLSNATSVMHNSF